jgi:flavin reductase (DIM6/NTAB) family NADH-FMN oxidoreductase RutF
LPLLSALHTKRLSAMTMPMPDFDLPDSMALRPLRRPAVSDGEFRAAMSGLASSVHVVTARRGNERVGRTVTSVLSLSAQPPAILVSIDIVSRLADLIAKTGGFSMALLAADQHRVADVFAGKTDVADRFDTGAWGEWPSGQPMLTGAVTVLDCEVIGAMETGTHVLFAGAIVEAETDAGRSPLLWHRHGYGVPSP